MADISLADVQAAEAELVDSKNNQLNDEERAAIAQRVTELRAAFRTQEVDAGRRAAGVAVTTGEEQ